MLTSNLITEQVKQGARVIDQGGVVAFPTETYYGLAVDPFNESALDRLFKVKKRPFYKPILTLVHDRSQVDLFTDASIPFLFEPLIKKYWPGPLTLILEASETVSRILTGETGTIGVRVSSNPIAQNLVKVFGKPITATSANLSGHPPATTPEQVRYQFGDALDLIIEGGVTPGGCGSTIIKVEKDDLHFVREGAISISTIQKELFSDNG